MNKVVLMGRITKDVELRTTQSGVSVAQFTIAVNRRYKNDAGQYDADFINCVAWRNTAEFISKYFLKGGMIAISGTLSTRSYEKDGKRVWVTEVTAEEAYFCGDGKGESKPAYDKPTTYVAQQGEFEEVGDGDDLPF